MYHSFIRLCSLCVFHMLIIFQQFLDLMVDDLKNVLKSGLFERAQLMVCLSL